MDRSASSLSFWFPKLKAAGLPVPETIMFEFEQEEMEKVFEIFDGKRITEKDIKSFSKSLHDAMNQVGFPCFLRTDYTSNKHRWKDSCFIESEDNSLSHVMNIIEFSEMVDFIGLPWQRWAVREYLPIIPLATCPRYGDMPVCREFRFFVDDGIIRCSHPYWPKEALLQGGLGNSGADEVMEKLNKMPEIQSLAEAAGAACPGSWSIDLLETKKGWYVTDMAEASQSFHWDGCPYSDTEKQEKEVQVDPATLIEKKENPLTSPDNPACSDPES